MYKKQTRKFCFLKRIALVGLCQAWQVVESSFGSSKGKSKEASRGGEAGRGWTWGWA